MCILIIRTFFVSVLIQHFKTRTQNVVESHALDIILLDNRNLASDFVSKLFIQVTASVWPLRVLMVILKGVTCIKTFETNQLVSCSGGETIKY